MGIYTMRSANAICDRAWCFVSMEIWCCDRSRNLSEPEQTMVRSGITPAVVHGR